MTRPGGTQAHINAVEAELRETRRELEATKARARALEAALRDLVPAAVRAARVLEEVA